MTLGTCLHLSEPLSLCQRNVGTVMLHKIGAEMKGLHVNKAPVDERALALTWEGGTPSQNPNFWSALVRSASPTYGLSEAARVRLTLGPPLSPGAPLRLAVPFPQMGTGPALPGWIEAWGPIVPGRGSPSGSRIRGGGGHASLASASALGPVTMAASPLQTRWFLLLNLENFTAAPTMNLYSVVNSVSLISMYLFPFLITFAFPSRIYN